MLRNSVLLYHSHPVPLVAKSNHSYNTSLTQGSHSSRPLTMSRMLALVEASPKVQDALAKPTLGAGCV